MFGFGGGGKGTLRKQDIEHFYRHVCDNKYSGAEREEKFLYNCNKIPGMFTGSGVNPSIAQSEADLIDKLVNKWAGSGQLNANTLRSILKQGSAAAATPMPQAPVPQTYDSRPSSPAGPPPRSGGAGFLGNLFGAASTRPAASPNQTSPRVSSVSPPASPSHRQRRQDVQISAGTGVVGRFAGTANPVSASPMATEQRKTQAQRMALRKPQTKPQTQAVAASYGARMRGPGNFYEGGIMASRPGYVQQGKYSDKFANRTIRVSNQDEEFFGIDMTAEEQIEKYGFIKFKAPIPTEGDDTEGVKQDIDIQASVQWARQNVQPQMVRSANGKTRRAEMGERGTAYPVFSTTMQELAHFGLGVAMYFWYLKDLILLLIIMAAINTYNLDYFSSDAYSPGGSADYRRLGGQPGVHWSMKGSATCTATTEVEAYMIGGAADTNRAIAAAAAAQASYSSNTVTEVHNLCQITKTAGIVNLVSLMVFFLYMIISRCFYDATIEELDEGMQTTSDYSVVVEDPPGSATNPDDWYDFFREFGNVALVTVVLDNGMWMQKMAYLRYCRRMYLLTSGKNKLPKLTVDYTAPRSSLTMFQWITGSKAPSYYLVEIVKTTRELKTIHSSTHLALHPESTEPLGQDPPSVCYGLCKRDIKGPLVHGWTAAGGPVSTPHAKQTAEWVTNTCVYPPESLKYDNPRQQTYYQQLGLERGASSRVNNPGAVLWADSEDDLEFLKGPSGGIYNDVEFTLRNVLAHSDQDWNPREVADRSSNQPPEGVRASKVFVTFLDERGQRNCLRKLNVSKMDAWFDTATSLPEKYRFNWGDPMLMRKANGDLVYDSDGKALVVCEGDIVDNDMLIGQGLDAFYFDTLAAGPEGASNEEKNAAFVEHIRRKRNDMMREVAVWERKRRVQRRYRDVLLVQEAPEPTTIKYSNVRNRKPAWAFVYTILRGLMGLVLAAGVVVAFYFIIKLLKDRFQNRFVPALGISVANVLLPPIMLLVTQLGFYQYETVEQMVYFWKLLLSRFVTTAVINFMLTDFDQMLDEDSIYRIQAILFADMITTPFLKWLNIWPRFQRWWFAPRAATQLAANMYYRGEPWQLADRYTDMIKTVFLVMFYAVLLPSGFWIAVFALIISFWVDKYMLLRRWVRKPEYGTDLPNAAYPAVMLTLLGGLYMSLYFYAGWPFDYACSAHDDAYGPFWHCERNNDMAFWDYFWPHVQGYMTRPQMQLVKIYRCLDTIVLIVFAIGFLAAPIYYFFYDLVFGIEYAPVGDVAGPLFNQVEEIQGYIPWMRHPGLEIPSLMAQVGDTLGGKRVQGGRHVHGREDNTPFDKDLVFFQIPAGMQYEDVSVLEDDMMTETGDLLAFSVFLDMNNYPYYYSRVKQYVDDGHDALYEAEVEPEAVVCVCVRGPGLWANIGRCCGCTFCLLTTIAFVFICFALALMHFCNHVDTSTVDSFEVPDTAFTDELLLANDSPHGAIQVVRTHYPQQYAVQVVAVNFAYDLASSQSLTIFDADVYRNEYSYEEFASVTAYTEFNSRFRILGYNVDCKNVEIMARLPQYLPSLRRVVARAAWDTNVVVEMQDPYTLEVATAFESVNITTDRGDVEVKGLKSTKWGIVAIETELVHNAPNAVVELFNVLPNVLSVQTVQARVMMERIWLYDGGLLSVSTHSGRVDLENIVMFGDYGSIVVETHSAPIVITLNARYFNGAFNLQSEHGLVYVDPGQFMAYEGGSPEECSASQSWAGMPLLRPGVPGHHSHCIQGRLGMPAGYNKLIAYSVHGNITVQFASFVEQPPGMYI